MSRRIARIVIVLSIIPVAAPMRSDAGGGCHVPGTTDAGTTQVVMAKNCFFPTIARVPIGAGVTWTNKDGEAHTVTGANASWGSLDELGSAKTVNVRFSRAGVYPYYCFFHPGMAGAIVVGDADGATDVSLGSTGSKSARNDGTVRLGATTAASSGPAWPPLAAGIGLMGLGVGFGAGRRARNGRRRTWERLEP